ncbi:hypothetical protein [Kribbella endophytica]
MAIAPGCTAFARIPVALPGTEGQVLITYHAVPGTPSHEKLELLAHLSERSPR